MKQEIAELLLMIKAVKIQPNEPFTFTSGLKSPIYIDNRLIISYPDARKKIVKSFKKMIKLNNLEFDVIAGVATAGIHWAAWLAKKFEKPMIYIRAKVKEHGRQNQIEGLLKQGQKVLVIEDHISTGGSSVAAVNAVKEAGGVVEHCLAITTYEFEKAKTKFEEAECNLMTLTDFTTLINTAATLNYINSEDKEKVHEWNKDAASWASKYGLE